MIRSLAGLVAIPVAAYLVLCVYFYVNQRSMLYFPVRVASDDPIPSGLERWTASSGQSIGWMTSDGDASRPILLLHGNSGHARQRISIVQRLRQAGITAKIFLLEYPGFGGRAGQPTEESLTAAAVAAVREIPSPVVLFGESLGSGVASQTAARVPDRIRGVILLTPFDSIVGAAAHHYPWLPVGWIVKDRFDSVSALSGFSKPVVLIVAGDDATTPPSGARRLFESLTGPKRMWTVPGAGHNGALDGLSDADWLAAWDFVSGDIDDGR